MSDEDEMDMDLLGGIMSCLRHRFGPRKINRSALLRVGGCLAELEEIWKELPDAEKCYEGEDC